MDSYRFRQLCDVRRAAEFLTVMLLPPVRELQGEVRWLEEVETWKVRTITLMQRIAPDLARHVPELIDIAPIFMRRDCDPSAAERLFAELSLIAKYVDVAIERGEDVAQRSLANGLLADEQSTLNWAFQGEVWQRTRQLILRSRNADHLKMSHSQSRKGRSAEESAEKRVRNYIRSRRSQGVPIQKITRDGVAGALDLSGGAVSKTSAWKALAREKEAERLPTSREEECLRAADRRDWEAVLTLQCEEQRRQPRRSA